MSPVSNQWRLDGATALVTGASRGIGAALAESLLERGARVCLVARGADDLSATAERLQQQYPGGKVLHQALDVADNDALENLLTFVQQQWSRLDVLINNVGTNIRKPAMDYSEPEISRLFDVNLHSAFALSRKCHGLLSKSDQAAIVNVASVAGLAHLRTGVVYGMTKAAMLQMTRNLAVEWAADGIRVNAIAPWYTDTPLARQVLQDQQYRQEVLDRTPQKRVASSREMADAAVFLCLPAAANITGTCLTVDGGMTVNAF